MSRKLLEMMWVLIASAVFAFSPSLLFFDSEEIHRQIRKIAFFANLSVSGKRDINSLLANMKYFGLSWLGNSYLVVIFILFILLSYYLITSMKRNDIFAISEEQLKIVSMSILTLICVAILTTNGLEYMQSYSLPLFIIYPIIFRMITVTKVFLIKSRLTIYNCLPLLFFITIIVSSINTCFNVPSISNHCFYIKQYLADKNKGVFSERERIKNAIERESDFLPTRILQDYRIAAPLTPFRENIDLGFVYGNWKGSSERFMGNSTFLIFDFKSGRNLSMINTKFDANIPNSISEIVQTEFSKYRCSSIYVSRYAVVFKCIWDG